MPRNVAINAKKINQRQPTHLKLLLSQLNARWYQYIKRKGNCICACPALIVHICSLFQAVGGAGRLKAGSVALRNEVWSAWKLDRHMKLICRLQLSQ